jgi:uncharacterized membrane protein
MNEFIGHLHPLVVHLPIGAVVLALGMAGIRLLPGQAAPWRAPLLFCLAAALAGGATAIVTGYYFAEGDTATLIPLHRLWGWITVASFAVALLAAWRESLRWFGRGLTLAAVLAAFVATAVTGHLGGTMVHGAMF